MRIIGNNPQLSRQTQGTASGAITGGKPVAIDTDGTVGSVGLTFGSATQFEAGGITSSSPKNAIAYDSSNSRVVIVYADAGDSGKGKAVVGTVSGVSISFGTPVEFEAGNTLFEGVAFDSNTNKVLVCFSDNGDSNKGKCRVGTVDSSDNSISFGTVKTFNNAATYQIFPVFDSNSNKIAIIYQDVGNSSYGTGIVATISGTDVSFGSETVFESASVSSIGATFDATNNKIVITYKDAGNSDYGTAVVGTISSTSISFGTASVFETSNTRETSCAFVGSSKTVIGYVDQGDSYKNKAIVATVSGTSISFGSIVELDGSTGGNNSNISVVYNTATSKAIIAYNDIANSSLPTVITGTVSGTSISFANEKAIGSTAGLSLNSVYIPNGPIVVKYGNSTGGAGNAIVFVSSEGVSLTSENFIGFAQDTVATGQPVTINTKGAIVDNMPQLASASQVLGSSVALGDGRATYIGSAFDSNSNRVVIAYRNDANSDYGTALVGTIDTTNNTLSYGTPVVFESANSENIAVTFDSNLNRIVIVYKDAGNSNYGTAIVGTVDSSDNSISFGSAVVFNSSGATSFIDTTFDSSNNKVVVVYQDGGNSNHGTAIVGTVDSSDNSISFGSAAVFESAAIKYTQCTFDSSNNKVVISYMDDDNSDHGTAIVGTVSGTSISFGSAAVFNSAQTEYINIIFDSTNNKIVIIYSDYGNSKYLTAIVGTVSGTSIGSFGSEVVFQSEWAIPEPNGTAFDVGAGKIIVGFRNVSGNDALIGTGTVSGSSISFTSNIDLKEGGAGSYITSVFGNNRVVMAFNTQVNNVGASKVLKNVGSPEDLTPAQTYFVQTDGTLGTSADDPSVTAGTAVAGSTLIVKG